MTRDLDGRRARKCQVVRIPLNAERKSNQRISSPAAHGHKSFDQPLQVKYPEAESRQPQPFAVIDCNAITAIMASITIRRLPENTKRRLVRAARNGHSKEQEARELLEAGLARADAEPENLGEAIHRIFAPLGGVDLKIPPRRGRIREIQFK
jgi:plasmid stability protein